MDKPQKIGDVMYTVAETEDVKNDQKVTLFRNGPIYTLTLFNSEDRLHPQHVRADMDRETAVKLYLKIVRAFVTGRYTWVQRFDWVAAAAEK